MWFFICCANNVKQLTHMAARPREIHLFLEKEKRGSCLRCLMESPLLKKNGNIPNTFIHATKANSRKALILDGIHPWSLPVRWLPYQPTWQLLVETRGPASTNLSARDGRRKFVPTWRSLKSDLLPRLQCELKASVRPHKINTVRKSWIGSEIVEAASNRKGAYISAG